MFALVGILPLLVVDYLKPQEYIPFLARYPLLYIFTFLALAGFVIDLRLGVSRLRATPQLPWVIGFYLWGLFTAAVMAPDTLLEQVLFMIQLSLYLVIAHTVQTFRSLQIVVGTLLAIGLFLAFVGVHQ